MKGSSHFKENESFITRYLRYLNFHTLIYLIELAKPKPQSGGTEEVPFPSPTF